MSCESIHADGKPCTIPGRHDMQHGYQSPETGQWVFWTEVLTTAEISNPFPNKPAPYQPHSATSKQAADDAFIGTGNARERVFLEIVAAHPDGLIDHEIQARLDMLESTERPRRGELVRDGYVMDSGRTRPAPSGEQASVWVLTEKGILTAKSRY